MTINVRCGCGKGLKVRDTAAGRRIKCPECGEPIKIPGPGQTRLPPSRRKKTSKQSKGKPANKSNSSFPILPVALVIGVLAVGGGLFAFFSGEDEVKPEEVASSTAAQTDQTDTASDTTPDSSDSNTSPPPTNSKEESQKKLVAALKKGAAITALRKLGVRFMEDGGVPFADFGFVPDSFPNDELKRLQAIPELVSVRLPAAVTDDGLATLKGLTNLKSIAILGNNVTDSGLEHVSNMSNLEQVLVWSNKVTQSGIDRLKQALPNCKVTWNR